MPNRKAFGSSQQRSERPKGGGQLVWLKRWLGLAETRPAAANLAAEKRKYPRVRCRHSIRQIGYDIDSCHLITETVDLSEGGLQITSSHPFQSEDILQLALILGRHEIYLIGRVAWSQRDGRHKETYRSGLAFLQIDQDDLKVIHAYIQDCLAIEKTSA